MVSDILSEWKKECGSNTPLLFKYKYEQNQICMYTSQPGYFIGQGGALLKKYGQRIKHRLGSSASVLLVETDWETL